MYRIVKLSGVYYAAEFDSIEDFAEDAQELVGQGDPVLIVNDLDDAEGWIDGEIVRV